MKMINRMIFGGFLERVSGANRHIQVLLGPRQVGKTTLVKQIENQFKNRVIYVSADEPALKGESWIRSIWHEARAKGENSILAIDEIQKIENWAESVKALYDEDRFLENNIQVILLGSSQLLLNKGLTESLAGRFEITYAPHWSFKEMHEAFGISVDEYIYFGGYPGSAGLIHDEDRWRNYLNDSLIETTISRDILLYNRIEKPALLRRTFGLACEYSGRILSYQKMQGQLKDAGNTTTIAHYLELLAGIGIVTGLQKFSNAGVRQRASSPKLQVFNTALLSAVRGSGFKETRENPSEWGNWVESAIGMQIINQAFANRMQVYYWREGNYEVDFVVQHRQKILAIEVKSGMRKDRLSGLAKFKKLYPDAQTLIVGNDGMSVETFLKSDIGLLLG